MPAILTIAATGSFTKTQGQLADLAERVDNLSDFNEEVGAYLVNAARNRIYSTKTAPDGTRWPENTALTKTLKGSGSTLIQSGELASSIRVTDADQGGVTVKADKPYAAPVQEGQRRMKGRYRSKTKAEPQVPGRAFMGISDTNRKRIAKMLRAHIAENLRDDDLGFGG